MRVRGAGAKPLEPNDSKPNWPSSGPPPGDRAPSTGCSLLWSDAVQKKTERCEAELAEFRPAARRSRAQYRLFAFLDGLCSKAALEAYLRDIADSDRSLSRQITELLELIRQYGPDAVAGAIEKAATA